MNSDLVEDCSKGSIMVSGPAGFSSHACTFLPVASFILWQTLPSTHAQHSEGFLRCLWYQPAGPASCTWGWLARGPTVSLPPQLPFLPALHSLSLAWTLAFLPALD